jgi:hypothetical protein
MKSAEQILDDNCNSLPAWTDRRKQAVLNSMEEYAGQFYTEAELLARLDALKKDCAEMGHFDGTSVILSIDINKYLKK